MNSYRELLLLLVSFGSFTFNIYDRFKLSTSETLRTIKKRGYIICGINGELDSFSIYDDMTETFRGYDIDCCAIVASIIFMTEITNSKDPDKFMFSNILKKYVKFYRTSTKNRFEVLVDKEVDILIRNTTITTSRNNDYNIMCPFVNYYDGGTLAICSAEYIKIFGDEPLFEIIDVTVDKFDCRKTSNIRLLVAYYEANYAEEYETLDDMIKSKITINDMLSKNEDVTLDLIHEFIIPTTKYYRVLEKCEEHFLKILIKENTTTHNAITNLLDNILVSTSKYDYVIVDNSTTTLGELYVVLSNMKQLPLMAADRSKLQIFVNKGIRFNSKYKYAICCDDYSSEPLGLYLRDDSIVIGKIIQSVFNILIAYDLDKLSLNKSKSWMEGGTKDITLILQNSNVENINMDYIFNMFNLNGFTTFDDFLSRHFDRYLVDEQKRKQKESLIPIGSNNIQAYIR